jgi:hypothetical protein
MLDSPVHRSLPEMVWNVQILAGWRMKTDRIGGFAHFLRRIERSARSRIAPLSSMQMRGVSWPEVGFEMK